MSDPGPISLLDDSPTGQDLLGFQRYAEVIAEIISAPCTNTPLTIGVFGPWGSGKTSLLKLSELCLNAKSSVVVWFNAWKYNQEDALWRAFIEVILDALRPRADNGAPLSGDELSQEQLAMVAELERLEESLYRTVEWEEVGRWTVDWLKALQGTTELAAELALSFVPGASSLVDLVRQVSKSALGETPGAREAFRRQVKQLRREQLRSVEQFEREFGRVMNDYVVKRGKRLVVFIDDLDRCLPERAIQVLEALKLFLCVRGGVFILGLDREAIEAAIATRFGEEFPRVNTSKR